MTTEAVADSACAPQTAVPGATRRAVLFGAATLAALSAGPGARAQTAAAAAGAAERASQVARALFDARPVAVPALSLAVATADGVIWNEAFGKADLDLDVDATPAHRFKLESVSKIVTATTAAKLVSRGVLDLDTPIATWLPDLPEQHRRTTMTQLFTHQSGIRHYTQADFDMASPGGSIDFRAYDTSRDILDLFIDDPLVGPPGAQIAYSTFAYSLASVVMEAASGQSFPDLVKTEIGAGFALPSLDIDAPAELRPMRVSGYNDDFARFMLMGGPAPRPEGPFTWTNARTLNPAYKWAGGGLIMTPSDLARFGAAHLDSPLSRITDGERALLFTQITEATENQPSLGLGWRVDDDDKGRRRWHHAGGYEGARASLVVYLELGLSIALASNIMSAPGNVLRPSSDLADAFI